MANGSDILDGINEDISLLLQCEPSVTNINTLFKNQIFKTRFNAKAQT